MTVGGCNLPVKGGPRVALNTRGVFDDISMLCNDVQREGTKANPDLAYELSCYMWLHNNPHTAARAPPEMKMGSFRGFGMTSAAALW
jgi:hypothetical protein